MRTIEETRQISELLERFFEGDTSVDEEQRLYRFFASSDIPPELEAYTTLMLDLAAMASVENEMHDGTDIETPSDNAMPTPHKETHVATIWRIVAATAAIILVAAGLFITHDIHEQQKLADLYGGSYMIVNGKRVDNLKKIRPQIEDALRMADMVEQAYDGNELMRQAEQNVLDNISDPVEREYVRRMLN